MFRNARFRQRACPVGYNFKDLHNCLDDSSGDCGRTTKEQTIVHHEPFQKDEIDRLWKCGVLGTSNPQSLLDAVFFYNSVHYCLHGGEHRKLKLEQITKEGSGYTYCENGSKNHKGTFRERNIANKVVHSDAVPEAGEQCHVHLLDVYLSKLPKDAHKVDAFYFCPLSKIPQEGPLYTPVPVGKHKLANMVKNMCTEAGLLEKKNNHSLWATAATALFEANVSQKLIQECTGHRSVEALRQY